jgi:predicted homoserine dehydrogenase-like protein
MRRRMLELLDDRARSGQPLRIGLIGCGTFGTMLLSQARRLSGVEVVAVADLSPPRAAAALERTGFASSDVAVEDNGYALAAMERLDLVVEATGAPLAGVEHALAAIEHGHHVVMVNVEADALAGPVLAARAGKAGVVYSLAYGDQPALVCELVDWARACGFDVTCAGKGTKYLPSFHDVTPETVWEQYGLTAAQVADGGYSARMFTSFIDGTKSAVEMVSVCNAAGLQPQVEGLRFPPAGTDELARVCIPVDDGGLLTRAGTVEVVSSVDRDGRAVERDLRWGVYVTFEAPDREVAAWLRAYGLATNPTGQYAALYRPYHLIGLEATVSVLSAALLGEPTGRPDGFRADAVAVAKRDLRGGEALDGEGGFSVYGALVGAAESITDGLLPVGLAQGLRLRRDIRRGERLRLVHVDEPAASTALDLRSAMQVA